MTDQTVIGFLVAPEAGAARATLRIDGNTHRGRRGDRLTIERDDGTQVTVVLAEQATVTPAIEREARWGELAEVPLAALFAEVAPGDHVEVELRGWWLAPGARLAVRGAPAPADDGAAAPVRSITARRIATVDAGDAGAIAMLDAGDAGAVTARDAADAAPTPAAPTPTAPTPAGEPRTWVPNSGASAVALVIGTGLTCAAIAGWQPVAASGAAVATRNLLLLAGGLHGLAAALALSVARQRIDGGVGPEATGQVAPPWHVGGAFVATAGMLAPLAFLAYLSESIGLAAVGLAGVALTAFALAGWVVVQHRRRFRLARLLLGARSTAVPLADAAWGRLEGVVAIGAEPLMLEVRFATVSETYDRPVTTRAGTHHREQTRYRTEGQASVATPDRLRIAAGGEPVDVQLAGALWAAPVTWRALAPGAKSAGTLQARVAATTDVIVLGRVRRTDAGVSMRATGPESLLLFGGTRAALLRVMAGWSLGWLALVVVGGTAAAAAIHAVLTLP